MLRLMLGRAIAIMVMATAKEGTVTTNDIYDVMRADEITYSSSLVLDDSVRNQIGEDWMETWCVKHDKAGNAESCLIATWDSNDGYSAERYGFGTIIIEDEED